MTFIPRGRAERIPNRNAMLPPALKQSFEVRGSGKIGQSFIHEGRRYWVDEWTYDGSTGKTTGTATTYPDVA